MASAMMTAKDARIAELELKLERVQLIAEAAFEAILGNRLDEPGTTYPCPDCDGPAAPHDFNFPGRLCDRCSGRGQITLRNAATVALWHLRQAERNNDSESEVRDAPE